MDVNHLKTNELSYELDLRGIESSGDVDRKRKLLRGCLGAEAANRSLTECKNDYPHDEDCKGIMETIKDLQKLIPTLSGNSQEVAYKRVQSRLIHVSGRISRVMVDGDLHVATKRKLTALLLELEGDLVLKTEDVPQASSTPVRTMAPELPERSPQSQFFVPPYKWNITFSGVNARESLMSFLERVEELRISRGVSKEVLFTSATDLLLDPAKLWYKNNRHKFTDWDSLVAGLKDMFLPPGYDQDLLFEIMNRRQGSSEKVAFFISAMQSLFQRMQSPPDNAIQLQQIRKNLLPGYITQLALTTINSIEELYVACQKLEESRVWADRSRVPGARRSGLLEPDLAYLDSEPVPDSCVLSSKCWNCSKEGHDYRSCRVPRRVFCFGCGRRDVVKSKCPRCQISKNETKGSARPDVRNPPSSKPSTSETTK